MTMRLFTTYYREKDPLRKEELDLCLRTNEALFHSIHVISEEPNPDRLPGMWKVLGRRETFNDVLAIMREVCGDRDVGILANADIYFVKSSIERIRAIKPFQVYCLTRWDVKRWGGTELWNVEYSQDCWCFKGPPREEINADFPFGVPGCDNRFAYELQAVGYEILNPSRSIPTYHLHLSNKSRPHNKKDNRVSQPYLFVWPHFLGAPPRRRIPEKRIYGPSAYQK